MSAIEVRVPDIGDFKDVPVIEVFVKAGDTVAADDSLVTLESDKATMDVPAPSAGVVRELKLKVGDKVSEGNVILTLESNGAGAAKSPAAATPPAPAPAPAPTPATTPTPSPAASPPPPADEGKSEGTNVPDATAFKAAHASPSVRVFARELGVDLAHVTGSGPKGRILHEDVQQFVKQALSGGAAPAAGAGITGGGALYLLPWPQVDCSKYGAVEAKPLPRIKKISGANRPRNWVMIPHVTQFDDADITDLEAFRVRLNKE